MKTRKKFLIPALVLTLASISGAVVLDNVNARGFGGGEGKDSFIQSLSEKFNLSQDEVSSFFKEQRTARQEERKTERGAQLSQLVSEGKLTADQKTALIAKMEENQAAREQDRDAFKDMTREERQADREAHRAEMDQWFADQGIDKSVLGEFGKGPGGPGGRQGQGCGNN